MIGEKKIIGRYVGEDWRREGSKLTVPRTRKWTEV